jgi:5-formyltetrahydrofolate cyclo-ligase
MCLSNAKADMSGVDVYYTRATRQSNQAAMSALTRRPGRVASAARTPYIAGRGAAGCDGVIPRGLTILTGAVPDRARGLGHMAPTYFCRFPGSPLRRPARLRTFLQGLGEDRSISMLAPDSARSRKAELRSAALERRDALPPQARQTAAEIIAARPLPVPLPPAAVVAGFSAIRSEINPVPLLRRFADAGAQLALPAIVARGRPLAFRAWRFGEELARGQWGIREPKPDAPEVRPDVVIVPLAAFDRRGYRIGYGAGYYDLTLRAVRAEKPITALGLAFAMQEIDQVPELPHDARLDLVLTEREVIECGA